jgi:hypothetical protein
MELFSWKTAYMGDERMNRKVLQLIVIAIILSTSLLIGTLGCGNRNSSGSTPTSTQITKEGQDIQVTSAASENHSHIVTIKWSDIYDSNRTSIYTTTENGTIPHVHSLTLSPQNFVDVKQGKTITVTSGTPVASGVGVVANHVHKFVIRR